MPGDFTASSAARSSFQRDAPVLRLTAWTTPLRSATYAVSPASAGGAKNAVPPGYVHRSAPLSREYARTLPSVQVTTASSFVSAAHETAPPGSSFFHFCLPSASEKAATTPLAFFRAAGS